MSIDTAVLQKSTEGSAEPIVFELLADAADFIELAYQPVCSVVCSDPTSG
ncbi:hypothetical protein [Nocardia vinacea]|nr:hypothetical protein [Nocardia vinacea]